MRVCRILIAAACISRVALADYYQYTQFTDSACTAEFATDIEIDGCVPNTTGPPWLTAFVKLTCMNSSIGTMQLFSDAACTVPISDAWTSQMQTTVCTRAVVQTGPDLPLYARGSLCVLGNSSKLTAGAAIMLSNGTACDPHQVVQRVTYPAVVVNTCTSAGASASVFVSCNASGLTFSVFNSSSCAAGTLLSDQNYMNTAVGTCGVPYSSWNGMVSRTAACYGATPVQSMTATSTPSPSGSRTAYESTSATPSGSASPARTISNSAAVTSTACATTSSTVSASATSTISATATPTVTVAASRVATVTAALSASATGSLAATPSVTAVASSAATTPSGAAPTTALKSDSPAATPQSSATGTSVVLLSSTSPIASSSTDIGAPQPQQAGTDGKLGGAGGIAGIAIAVLVCLALLITAVAWIAGHSWRNRPRHAVRSGATATAGATASRLSLVNPIVNSDARGSVRRVLSSRAGGTSGKG